MKAKNGQALVEFIIILPILIILLLAAYDLFNIFYHKNNTENDLSLISDLYKENKIDKINEYIVQNNYEIEYLDNDEIITIKLKKEIKMVSLILSNPFEIEETISLVKEG